MAFSERRVGPVSFAVATSSLEAAGIVTDDSNIDDDKRAENR